MTASALPASAAHASSGVLQRARSDPAYAAFLLLRIGFTVLPIVFGLDKFTNVLTKWEVYLAPWIVDMSPISAHQVMLVVGVIEIVAGVAVAIKPRYAAYIVAAWLAGIIVNLLSYPGFYDVALRDFGLLLAALTLGRPGLGVRPGLASAHQVGHRYPGRVVDPTVLPSVHPAPPTPATGERRDPLVSGRNPPCIPAPLCSSCTNQPIAILPPRKSPPRHSFVPWGFHWIPRVLPAHPRGWRAATPSCSHRGPSI